jgi:hypothetical protein
MEPKILFFDIETAPIRAWVWGLFKQNIAVGQIDQDWYMLCYAAKWLGSDEIIYDAIWHDKKTFKKDPSNDYQVVSTIWDLLDEADIVVAHNADRFDVNKVRAKFYEYGFEPPSPFKVVDTLKVSRANFGHSTHRLDHIANKRNLGRKLKTDFDLWLDCMSGNKDQQDKMIEYNIHDVELLEDVYLEMRPWVTNHPNYGVYTDGDQTVCPKCGSVDLHHRGYAYTTAGKFRRIKCNNCGGWSRYASNELDISSRRRLARNVAK